MLTSQFLTSTAAKPEGLYRGKLLNRHAAARAVATTPAGPESISPMTIALVAVADLRTAACPDAPSISSLIVATAESEIQVVPEIITTAPTIIAVVPAETMPADAPPSKPKKVKKRGEKPKLWGLAAVPLRPRSHAGSQPDRAHPRCLI